MADGSYSVAALCYRDRDREFTTPPDYAQDRHVDMLGGKTWQQWHEAHRDHYARIELWAEGAAAPELLVSAERLVGPVAPREEVSTATFAWARHNAEAGLWELQLHQGGSTETVAATRAGFPRLSVAALGGATYFAFRSGRVDRATVTVLDEHGEHLAAVAGTNPVLRAGAGRLWLLTERVTPDAIDLRLHAIAADGAVEPAVRVPAVDAYNVSADLLVTAGRVDVAWETSPAWGDDPYVGSHRRIAVATADLEGHFGPAGLLPIPPLALQPGHPTRRRRNLPPIRPRLIAMPDASPAVAYRRHHAAVGRTYGWHVWMLRREAGRWHRPQRVSTCFGASDVGYDIVHTSGEFLGLFPACDNRLKSSPCENFRYHVERFTPSRPLGEADLPRGAVAAYLIPPGRPGLCPSPPPLEAPPEGYRLLWGDLHVHSNQSKCMTMVDGAVEENIRFHRDTLGCEVIGLTDHHHHMSRPEWHWMADKLDEEAPPGTILFHGTEPGIRPGDHTNTYARDRETLLRYVALKLTHFDRPELYAAIREAFAPGEILCLRHIHGTGSGAGSIYSEENVRSHAADLEPAMEVIQVRGTYFFDAPWEAAHLMPTNFLNAGCKVGLLGGTDHTNHHWQPNAFGLTGFWVTEATIDGVFEAIIHRRTLATANGKLAIWAELAGTGIGREVRCDPGPLQFRVQLAAGRPIRRATLLRNGEFLPWTQLSPDFRSGTIVLEDPAPLPGENWYVVAAQAESLFTEGMDYDPDDPCQRWCYAFASPHFVTL